MKLRLIADIEAENEDTAQAILDDFREATIPEDWGIYLYRDEEIGPVAGSHWKEGGAVNAADIKVGDFLLVEKVHNSIAKQSVIQVSMANQNYYQGFLKYVPESAKAAGHCAVGQLVNFLPQNVIVCDRPMRSEIVRGQAEEVRAEGEAKLKEAERLLRKANALTKYASDSEEVAALLIEAQEMKGTPEQKIKRMAEVLEGRVSTHFL